jgi:hypothetical protein
VQLGDLPGVGMTIIDGIVRTQRSRNTPPATKVPEIVGRRSESAILSSLVGWVERSDTHRRRVIMLASPHDRLSSRLHFRGAASSSNGRRTFSKVMGFATAQPILRALAHLGHRVAECTIVSEKS